MNVQSGAQSTLRFNARGSANARTDCWANSLTHWRRLCTHPSMMHHRARLHQPASMLRGPAKYVSRYQSRYLQRCWDSVSRYCISVNITPTKQPIRSARILAHSRIMDGSVSRDSFRVREGLGTNAHHKCREDGSNSSEKHGDEPVEYCSIDAHFTFFIS